MNVNRTLLALTAALALILGTAGASQASEFPHLTRPGATEAAAEKAELESWLASDEVTRLDFRAISVEQARELIGQTVDGCLPPDGPLAGLAPAARADLAVRVVRGLESSKFRETVRTFAASGKLARDKALVVTTPEDAAELGTLIGETGALALRLTGGADGQAVEQAAQKIFSGIAIDTESGVTLLRQYRLAVRDFAELPDDKLRKLLKIGR
jgi:hypothetical protein